MSPLQAQVRLAVRGGAAAIPALGALVAGRRLMVSPGVPATAPSAADG
jgi:hypothetical protein